MRYIKLSLILLIASFLTTQCSTPPRLGLDKKTPLEEGVHVILHPTLNLLHYNNIKQETINDPKTAHHFLIAPGEQTMGVKSAYKKKIWAFYSRVHDVAINGKPGETYVVCSRFIREKNKRPPTGGAVDIETQIDLLLLTKEQTEQIYIDEKVQVDYLRSICPVEQ